MPINHPIQLVPAVKRVKIGCGGFNKDLEMEFLASLNIITGPGIVLGESVILRSMLRTVFPSSFYPYPLSAEHYFNTGCVSLEFMYHSVAINISTLNKLTGKPSANDHYGRYMLGQLNSYIRFAPENMALLIEDEATCDMNESGYSEAAAKMNDAACQIICVIGNRFSQADFPDARIFSCNNDSGGNIRIELLQQGRCTNPVYNKNMKSTATDYDMVMSGRNSDLKT